ncbi:MAG: hypothetical protein IJR36_03635 [Lachnospiraceae bacterium]|nr:hypothetical protein [Lachnospiraceae bacterium]MBQ9592950.1 hypothetical protein [Lachnospiraceae bacterium]MBR0152691.1 hypothetical protein [Lachnospiraceae bacterium]
MIALLVPTVTAYPPLNFYAIHQFVMHGMITAYIVARYAGGNGGLPYLLGLAVLIIIVFHLMYALYAALDKRSGKKKR